MDRNDLRQRLAAVDDAARELLLKAGWVRLDHKGVELWMDPNTTHRWKLPFALGLLRKDLRE